MDETKKRGRPVKEDDDPVVNESPVELEMEKKEGLSELNQNLVALYNRVLRGSATSIVNLNNYNPFIQNQRLKTLVQHPHQMSREELIATATDPGDNESNLRSHSWALAASQYLYYKILRLACDVPMYNYYVTPEYLESPSKYKAKDFVEDDEFVNNWLDTFDIKNTLKRCALEVKRDGKATYILRNRIEKDADGKRQTAYATWQKLPNEYVRLVKIGEHGYIASFNLMIFANPAYSTSQYPQWMTKVWDRLVASGAVKQVKDKMTNGFKIGDTKSMFKFASEFESEGQIDPEVGERLHVNFEIKTTGSEKEYLMWLELPQTLCYTFCSDTSHPWFVPDTTGLLLPLDELKDYDTLQGLVESTPLTAILTGEAEAIPNPMPGQDQTIINPETLTALQECFNQSTSTNLEAFFAPLKNFQLLSLPSQPNSSEISANATKNVITRAGLGGLIITTDKPSVAQVKAAELLIESECNFVTLQFESVLNMIINEIIGCHYKWKLHIWGGIFTFADEYARDKEMFVAGATFVLPKLVSAYGINMRDEKALAMYVDSLKVYDDFKTITQVMQEKMQAQQLDAQAQAKTGAGRPTKSDSDVDNDNTAASKDSGLNTADMR